ncbi:MAG: TonB family protein [Sorangiineae bacterium]|nr:TonB family protein [Sorangiineae bacterium]
MVPLASLSRKPSPPTLDARLRAHYPPDARREGRSGSARVIARIDPDGVARDLRIMSASEPAFGVACRETVAGSRWSSPIGPDGQPVATEVRYRCRFEVER